MAHKATAFITGAGPGTGAAIARLFGESYNLILMSRSLPGSLSSLKLDNVPESNILTATYDGTPECYKKAVAEAERKWPEAKLKVGICNNGGPWLVGPFLEKTSEEFKSEFGLDWLCVRWGGFALRVVEGLRIASPLFSLLHLQSFLHRLSLASLWERSGRALQRAVV